MQHCTQQKLFNNFTFQIFFHAIRLCREACEQMEVADQGKLKRIADSSSPEVMLSFLGFSTTSSSTFFFAFQF